MMRGWYILGTGGAFILGPMDGYHQKGAEGWRFGTMVPESLSLGPSSATQQACWACGQETRFAVPVSQVEEME